MSTTTIQVKDTTKKALFLEKNRLERELGRSLTYDDVIEYLLGKEEKLEPDVNKEEFFGMMNEKARKIYSELRKEYKKNDF